MESIFFTSSGYPEEKKYALYTTFPAPLSFWFWYNIRHEDLTMNISYHDARYILDLDALSVTQKLLLFALLTHMHPGTKRIYPSYATLSTELGCDRRTVMRNINFLTKNGVLEVRK